MSSVTQNLITKNNRIISSEVKSPLFLFISENDKISYALEYCASTFKNFESAKIFLIELDLTALPDLIIIDKSLDFFSLSLFKKWMIKNLFYNVPIIYNEASLTSLETGNLFHLKLIDDVIKCPYDLEILGYKSNFFKSLNTFSSDDLRKEVIKTKTFKHFLRIVVKRLLDILISLIGIILTAPFLIIIAVIIKITSKGPAIYKSKRAGQGFKVFGFYKFRTMVIDADKKVEELKDKSVYNSADGSNLFFKMENDPRVTKIGSFLRNTSIDELPQLFNVLKGDMSLVGNRPLPLYEANSLTTSEWAERFMAPAGITGLWQISKRGKANMSNEERISLDIAYARKTSIRRDLKILVSTPSALIQKQNH